MSDSTESKGSGAGICLIMLPVILVAAVSSAAGYVAAKSGEARGVVRALLFPANFIISNFMGVCLLVGVNFLYAATIGRGRDSFLYAKLTDFLDLTLFTVWGRFIGWVFRFHDAPGVDSFALQVPFWHVLLFQVVLWVTLGNLIAKHWTDVIMWLAGRK